MATPVFTSMAASPGDPLHDLLVKATYWAQLISESGGGSPGMAIYPNMSPSTGDSLQTLAAKLVYWISSISAGGGGTVQVYTGAAPPAAPSNPTSPAIFYPTGGGGIQEWDVASQAWI